MNQLALHPPPIWEGAAVLWKIRHSAWLSAQLPAKVVAELLACCRTDIATLNSSYYHNCNLVFNAAYPRGVQ
jgi:hypothetical protein